MYMLNIQLPTWFDLFRNHQTELCLGSSQADNCKHNHDATRNNLMMRLFVTRLFVHFRTIIIMKFIIIIQINRYRIHNNIDKEKE